MRENLTLPLAGILHNLNNYLQAIIGNAALGMNSPLGCVADSRFRTIQYTAERCSETIKRLMAMVMSAQRESSPIGISAVISETIEVFKPVAANIQHIVYSCDDVPDVYGNESDISQILLNLLYNARDAIPHNGKIIISLYHADHGSKIKNGMVNPEDYVCISIRDNGPGIPESIQEKLFTEVKSTKKETAVNGFGLVVSQFLAERHGGWIECVHTDRNGTEFAVYFKVCNEMALNKESVSELLNESDKSTRTTI